jgi:hypothetical protein
MNQVKTFEVKLLRENNINKEKLSIKASFKILGNDQRMSYNIKLYQIGIMYNPNLQNENEDYTENLPKLCKYLKS